MGMTQCSECKNEISTTAAACPKCGAKQRRTSSGVKILVGFIVLTVIISIAGKFGAEKQQAQAATAEAARVSTLTPEQLKAEADAKAKAAAARAARDTEITAVAACQQFVLKKARNPDTMQFLDELNASYVEKKKNGSFHAQVKTRGENGFGGKTLSTFDCKLRKTGEDQWILLALEEIT